MASQVQIPFEGVILQEHSAPISCPTPNFAKGSYIDFIGSGRDSYSDFEASMRLETTAWVRVQRLRLVQKLGLVSTPSPASNK